MTADWGSIQAWGRRHAALRWLALPLATAPVVRATFRKNECAAFSMARSACKSSSLLLHSLSRRSSSAGFSQCAFRPRLFGLLPISAIPCCRPRACHRHRRPQPRYTSAAPNCCLPSTTRVSKSGPYPIMPFSLFSILNFPNSPHIDNCPF